MATSDTLNEVKYKINSTTTEDVMGLNIDDYKWRKPFSIMVPSTPTGVASITVARSATESNCGQVTASTTLANGSTVLYGDTISASATAATGYNNPTVSVSGVSSNKVTGNVAVSVTAGSLKTYTVSFTDPANGSWLKSSLTLSYGTTWSKSNNTITFTKPDGSSVSNSVTANSLTTYTLSFANPADGTSGGSWNSTTSVVVPAYTYVTPSISGNSTGTITGNITFTASITESVYTFNNTLSAAPTNASVSGSQIWEISGTDALGSAFSRKFTTTSHNAYYYYTISRNSSATKPTANITFTPTVTKTGHTYYVYYEMGQADGGEYTLPETQSRVYPNGVTLGTNATQKFNTTASGCTLTYANGTATGGTLPSSLIALDTTHYTANGWTTSSSAYNDLDYANGASFGSNSVTNLTLYPNFTTSITNGSVTLGTNSMTKSNTTANSYTVTYLHGTGTSGTLPSTQTVSDQIRYTANGWTTTSGSQTQTYANGASTGALTNNLTVYPCFTQSTVANDGVTLGTNSLTKSSQTVATYTVTYNYNGSGAANTSATAAKTRTYTANGWTTVKDSTTCAFTNGEATGQLTSNWTLYPCFAYIDSVPMVTLPTATRSGYTFKGWATSSTATSGVTGRYTVTGNVTLYAIWEAEASWKTVYEGNISRRCTASGATSLSYFPTGTWQNNATRIRLTGTLGTGRNGATKVNFSTEGTVTTSNGGQTYSFTIKEYGANTNFYATFTMASSTILSFTASGLLGSISPLVVTITKIELYS